MKNRNRILAMLLSVMMVLTYMPAIAFAEGEEPADPDTPASEQVEEPTEEQPAETDTANPAPAANPADSDSTLTEEDEPESEEPQNEEETNTQEPLKPAKSPKAETTPSADIADSNELLWDYLNKEVSSELGNDTGAKKPGLLRALNRTRGDRLEGVEQTIYYNLKSQIEAFADPNNEETAKSSAFYVPLTALVGSYYGPEEISVEGSDGTISAYGIPVSDFESIISGDDFAFDSNKIISALLSDLPYAMYWYDKTTAADTIIDDYYPDDDYVYFATDAGVWFYLYVSADFSVDGKTGTTDFDTDKVDRVKTAVNNATGIIDNASGSNLEILNSYKDAICSMTDYDEAAAADDSTPYGDPWQLISVFDNDADTKVVCEGYSKAFQFLCDNTYALTDAGIECDSVTGIMTGGIGEGNHMWNILHMDDNRNYIADITNCDEGTAADDKLFLKGANAGGSVADGYAYACGVSYTYDEDTRSQFSDKELAMSEKDYSATEEVVWDDDTGLAYALVNSDGEEIAKVVGYKGTATTITIPEELGGRPVRSFAINPNKPVEGDNTDYSTIKSLVLPENMIYIRGKCIRRFEGLESITITENAFFKTDEGVLYKKIYDDTLTNYEGVEVVYYPSAKADTEWTMLPDTLEFYYIASFSSCIPTRRWSR